MLKHQRQGPNECLITTIAVLMNLDRQKLLQIVRQKVVDKDWDYFSTQERELALDALKQEFRDRFPSWLNCGTAIEPLTPPVDIDFVRYHVDHFIGALTILHPHFGAHIAPYDHGIMLDTSMNRPLAFNVWGRRWGSLGFYVASLYCDFESYGNSIYTTEGMPCIASQE